MSLGEYRAPAAQSAFSWEVIATRVVNDDDQGTDGHGHDPDGDKREHAFQIVLNNPGHPGTSAVFSLQEKLSQQIAVADAGFTCGTVAGETLLSVGSAARLDKGAQQRERQHLVI